METIKKQLLNLRPYSWVDLILLGYLVNFSATHVLSFSFNDLVFIVETFLWWFFFNSIFEMKKNHSYRAHVPRILPTLFLLSLIILALLVNKTSLVPLVVSVTGIILYLKKNEQKFWGVTSCITRGLIQASFFVFLLFFLKKEINTEQIIISVVVFLLFTERAILGDLRDEKPDKTRNKMTIAVVLGIKNAKWLSILLLLISASVLYVYFDSALLVLPLLLLTFFLFFYSNGYILHQLMIFTTSAIWVNCIAISTEQNLVLLNLVYLGILFNLVFYPLLERKSNPRLNS